MTTTPPLHDDALSTVLPHEMLLDADAGIVLLSTPSRLRSRLALGTIWRVEPVNIEVMAESACLDLARRHEALVRGLPIGAALQTLTHLRPCTQMPGWKALRAHVTPQAPYAPLVDAQYALLRAGFPHRTGSGIQRLRDIETLVTVRVPLTGIAPSLGGLVRACCTTPRASVRHLTRLLRDQLQEVLGQFRGTAQGVEDSLRAAGHTVERLTGLGVGQALARALDPLADDAPALAPDVPLRLQARHRGLESLPGGFIVPNDPVPLAAELLSLHTTPTQTYPGMLCAPRAPAGSTPLALWDVWPSPLTIATHLVAGKPEAEKKRLEWRLLMASLQQAWSPTNRELKAQLETILRTMFVGGGGIMWGRVHLLAWGNPETLATETPSLIRAGRRLGLEFAQEPDLGTTLALQTLPLGFDPTYPAEWVVQRARRLERETLMDLLGLYGSMRGTKTPHALCLNRRGEALGFWPFDSPTNAHMIIKGSPGAGKSFFTAWFLNQVLPLGAAGIVLDRLPSYGDLVRTWGGRNLVMDFNQPICFNPFYGPLDDAHKATVTAILAHMASGGREAHLLDQEHLGVLATAVGTFAAERRGGEEATLGQFVREHLRSERWVDSKRTHRMAESIARRLGQYVGSGSYAGFTDGKNQLELDPVLTVLEFSKLGEASDLQSVLLLALMHLMSVFYSDPARLAQAKYFFCDEVWHLLQNALMGSLLQEMGLTYRKLGVCCAFISQLASHFETGAGQTLRNISAFQIFLEQEASEIPAVRDVFNMTPPEVALFTQGDVRRQVDSSSFYLRMAGHTGGIGRLVADPVTRWQVTQLPRERALRTEAFAKADGHLWQALASLAEQYPHGVTAP